MKKTTTIAFYAVIILVVGGALAFKIFEPVQVLPRIRLSPGYALIDQDGEQLSSEDMRGQFTLYAFTYTNCPSPCQDIDQTMLEIQNRLDEVANGEIPISLTTISFDPERDTPDVLSEYQQAVGADPEIWQFATNQNEQMLKNIIGGGFEVYYEPEPGGDYKFDPVFILVDGEGLIRGEYRYETLSENPDRIIRHMNILAEEVRSREAGNGAVYDAAHLFLCYAE